MWGVSGLEHGIKMPWTRYYTNLSVTCSCRINGQSFITKNTTSGAGSDLFTLEVIRAHESIMHELKRRELFQRP